MLRPSDYRKELRNPNPNAQPLQDSGGFSPSSFDEVRRRGNTEVFGAAYDAYPFMHCWSKQTLSYEEMERRYLNPYLLLSDVYSLMKGYYSYCYDVKTAVHVALQTGKDFYKQMEERHHFYNKLIENARWNLPTDALKDEFEIRVSQEETDAMTDLLKEIHENVIKRIKRYEVITKRNQERLATVKDTPNIKLPS